MSDVSSETAVEEKSPTTLPIQQSLSHKESSHKKSRGKGYALPKNGARVKVVL